MCKMEWLLWLDGAEDRYGLNVGVVMIFFGQKLNASLYSAYCSFGWVCAKQVFSILMVNQLCAPSPTP